MKRLTGKARAAWGISEENLLDLFWLWHWFQRKCQKVHSPSSAFWFWWPWTKIQRRNNNANLMLQLLLTYIVRQTIPCYIPSTSSGPDKSGSWCQHCTMTLPSLSDIAETSCTSWEVILKAQPQYLCLLPCFCTNSCPSVIYQLEISTSSAVNTAGVKVKHKESHIYNSILSKTCTTLLHYLPQKQFNIWHVMDSFCAILNQLNLSLFNKDVSGRPALTGFL